ncbi:restriction endonuclease subunit S [Evansella sp. AB-rgal1]|uniref:restriction endonuclease subunit S n=1 Tax=Evansella sp. AB-rgal1 TaxID=3242696 RepID=UPI00359E63EC
MRSDIKNVQGWARSKVKYELKNLDHRRIPISSEQRGKMSDRKYDYYGASGVIDKVEDYLFDEPLILIGEDGENLRSRSTSLAFLATGKYWVNNHAHILKPINGDINFMMYKLNSINYVPYITGSAQPKLTRKNLDNIELLIPSLNEQILISTFLNRKVTEIDDLIADKEKLIKLLEEKRQAVITEAVTKGLDRNVKMKDSGVEWIGEIPEHWEEKRIKYLFSEVNDRNFNEKAELLSLFTSIGVRPRKDMEQKGNKSQTVINYKIVRKGDIVVNKLLAWMGSIGISIYDGVTSPDYDVYRPLNKDLVSKDYFHYYFRNFHFKGDCYKFGRGIMLMRWRTYSEDFKKILVTLPPIEEQNRIADYLDKISNEIEYLIDNNLTIINKLKEYRQSLIYEAVTGKIDVREMVGQTEQEEVSSS